MSRKLAFGFCDRTGFRYPIDDLVPQYENGIRTGLLVGKDVVDIDHEQWKLGDVNANDKQTLDDPRPDQSLIESRAMFSWNPIGIGNMDVEFFLGRITVSID